ncbi:nitroreductase [Mangrovicella endophytica]|uniref:nitroreductase n=1 Tax=Mangrovicella endophytica TaxID=2066697 RepID=UPI0018E48630|nr:nitroreductase [Mangrovicella endophytica]
MSAGPSETRGKTVSEAVAAWRSVRAFDDRAVDAAAIRDILRRAARAPSGGNLQPWVVETVEGERLAALKALMRRLSVERPEGEAMAYDFYPRELKPAYLQRRRRNGEILYDALGIDREDKAARTAWINENFQFFGAPYGVLLFIERSFGPSQWLDLGIYLQTVLLLLTEAGYGACPQADWAMFDRSVSGFLGMPPDLTLVCGVAIGFTDTTRPENRIRTERDDPLARPDGDSAEPSSAARPPRGLLPGAIS